MSETKIKGFGLVRFSHAHVWKPKKNDEGTEKYSVAILWPKSDKALTKKAKAAVQAAIDAGSTVLKGKTKGLKLPIRDGDEKEGDGAYAGMWFINCNSDQPPGIVGPDKAELENQKEFYSGCYGYASINFFAYNRKGNAGVGCGLNNLMKAKDGPPLSGRGNAEDDFADIEIEDDEYDFDDDADDEASDFF
jgi:hypothetical protein